MQDHRGHFYYPFPQNKRVRMYVRSAGNELEFRIWNQDDAQMWEDHGWVPYSAIVQAAAIYKGGAFDPGKAYDLQTARALIREAG
jgi:hypothetical protein